MKEDDYCVVVYKILNYMYECLRTDTRVSYGLFENDGVLFPKLNKRYLYDAHEFIDSYEVPTYLKEMIRCSNVQTHYKPADE